MEFIPCYFAVIILFSSIMLFFLGFTKFMDAMTAVYEEEKSERLSNIIKAIIYIQPALIILTISLMEKAK